jgi:hypothetical protein
VAKVEPVARESLAAYEPPVAEGGRAAPDKHPLGRYRWMAMVGFAVASLLDGVVQASPATTWERAPAAFAMASACTMWCVVDSSMRGQYYPHSFRWLTTITWPLAMPVFLIRTRRLRGALLALGGLAMVIVTQGVGYFVGKVLRGN